MLTDKVIHFGTGKQFGDVFFEEFLKQIFRISFGQTLRNFNFFFFFLLLLFLFIFLFLDSVLDSHVVKLQINDSINELFQFILNLRPHLILCQFNVIIFGSHFSRISVSPNFSVLLDSLLKFNYFFSWTNVDMLVQEFLNFVLFTTLGFCIFLFVFWFLLTSFFLFYFFLFVKLFSFGG